MREDIYPKTIDFIAYSEQYFNDLAFELKGDIIFSKINIPAILKAVGVDIDLDGQSLSEKIINYMELVREYDRDKLFVFVNMRSFICDSDLEKIFDTFIKHQYHVLIIDNCEHEYLDNEYRFIVDKDLCEIG